MPEFRVDPAHLPSRVAGEEPEEPLLVLLQAVAGRDAQRSEQQWLRQSEGLGDQWLINSGSERMPVRSEDHELQASYDSTATRDHWLQVQRELNQRRAQLERFHAETERLYQSSLQMRLVSEQLWAQVVASIPTSEAVSRLRGLRKELSDSFQEAELRLSSKRDEIEQVARQLALREKELLHNQRAFAESMREGQSQLRRKMEQLAYREQQLLGSVRDSVDFFGESGA